MSGSSQSYFVKALLVLAAASLMFWLIKPHLPQKLFTTETKIKEIAVDSLLLRAIEENEEAETDTIVPPTKTKTPKELPDLPSLGDIDLISFADFDLEHFSRPDSTSLPAAVPLDSYTGVEYLDGFFKKLDSLKSEGTGEVRIAYYGDSMIEADLIVQKFRELLQTRYGGRGVGFVPMADVSSRARYSVKHRHQGWTTKTFMRDGKSLPYGINGGLYMITDTTASVNFRRGGIRHTYRLYGPRVFYGTSGSSDTLVVETSSDSLSRKRLLPANNLLNTLKLDRDNPKDFELKFMTEISGDSLGIPYYGVDFSDGTGIHVDNFAMRGNSGLPLSHLSPGIMNAFQKKLGYDLIILQFGANVLSTKAKSFNWYSRRMTRVVSHLNTCFPDVPILVIGTADKSLKIEGRMRTDSTVVKLLHAQQKFAAQTRSGFISLFHLMGGINSMPRWAEHSPKMAVGDYTHFSPRGAQIIGRRLFNELERYHPKTITSKKTIDSVSTGKVSNTKSL